MAECASRRPRVIFVHQVGTLGGAGVTLAGIVAAFDREVMEPIVVCPEGDVCRLLRAAGAIVEPMSRPLYQLQHVSGYWRSALHPRFLLDSIGAVRQLGYWRKFFEARHPEVVHLNSLTLLPLAWAAKRAKSKVVCLVQETAVRGMLGVRTALLRTMLSRLPDAVVFISEFDRRAFHPEGPAVEVIPNWVDFSIFDRRVSKSAARERVGVPADAQVVLFLGGISELKGTLPLLDAVARLGDVPRLLVLVAGNDRRPPVEALSGLQRLHLMARRRLGADYHERVSRFISSHALEERVRFLGPCDEVVPLYACADVVVFPAVAPHQARPILEAGAMAKPVVSSEFPNLAEFVHAGETALTVPPNDPAALAAALRRVLGDPALASRLGEANYALAREKHDGVRNARRFTSLYERLAQVGGGHVANGV